MYFLAHAYYFRSLASEFHVGVATAFKIIHDCVAVMKDVLVSMAIRFPAGLELQRVTDAFEQRCGLPLCAGALDGTFVRLKKPREWGDTYWCYKGYVAILLLRCV